MGAYFRIFEFCNSIVPMDPQSRTQVIWDPLQGVRGSETGHRIHRRFLSHQPERIISLRTTL